MEDKQNSNQNNTALWAALSLAWSLGYSIAIPLIVFALLGKFLDNKFQTYPWLFLSGIIISIIVSIFIIYKKITNILTDIKK